MTENFSVQAETCRPFPNFFSATVVTQKFTTIVIPGNPGEGPGATRNPGNLRASGFRRYDGKA
jgi:hypothetical protein